MTGILGKKIGMTNIFDEEGRAVPVTLIEAGPCYVLETKSKDVSGYSAVLLGYGDKKASKVNMPQKKWFDKLKISPKRTLKEIRLQADASCKTGDKVTVNIFKVGDYVDITGKSIGKGFQGGMKRWNWRGGESGHGSMFHRRVGSIGASSFPSRVHKGKTMPGHMGAAMNTVQNLKVVKIVEEDNLLVVKGAVPGHKDSVLMVRQAKKKPALREKEAVPDAGQKTDENKE